MTGKHCSIEFYKRLQRNNMKLATYEQANSYLEQYIRLLHEEIITTSTGKIVNPLERFKQFLELLGNPQEKFPSIVVSGTAGKGSTIYLIARTLQQAGYKTGMKVSPHLQKINERMQINGVAISDEEFISLVNDVKPVIEKMQQTEFEAPSHTYIMLAIAFLYFAKHNVAIAVIEVGIEGKYDGTNTLYPLLFILSNIGLDHTDILGTTVEAIAQEATWTIRHALLTRQTVLGKQFVINAPIILTGASQSSIVRIVKAACQKIHTILFCVGKDFSYTVQRITKYGSQFDFHMSDIDMYKIQLSLLGAYQITNASLAIASIVQLKRFGFSVSEQQIKDALISASFSGRFEMTSPNIIFDVAHNPMKMQAFITALQAFYPKEKKIFLVAFKKAKDVGTMLQILTKVASTIIITEFHAIKDPKKNFSMKAEEVYREMLTLAPHPGCEVLVIKYTKKAYQDLLERTKQKNTIGIVTGSLYLVGEVKNILEKKQ